MLWKVSDLMTTLIKNTCVPIALLLFLSCGSRQVEEVETPANILSEEMFTKVLVDFALAESAYNLNIKNVPAQRFDTTYAFNPLSENHISKAKYDSTILFYAHHPNLYKKIYENVLAALSEIKTKRDTLRKDSVPK